MVSIDLKDAYLQVPVLPDNCHFLCFIVDGIVCQSQALCFGLSTVPQVFNKVMMTPVSVMLHAMGIRTLRYLDYWLILASSRSEALWVRDEVLSLCDCLGIAIKAKSCMVPSQTLTYLEMVIMSLSLRAFPYLERVSILLTQAAEFLSFRRQNVMS